MNASGRFLARLTVLGALSASEMTAALPVRADDASPEPSQRLAATELAALHGVPRDHRGDFIPSLKVSLKALPELPEDAPAVHSWAKGDSRTGRFGEAWTDVDGDGRDTRNEILARDLEDADFSRVDSLQFREEGRGRSAGVCPNATAWAGVLQDPYAGRRTAFTRSQETSAVVQIDHVVPLNCLYAHGIWQWDERARLLVANDPLNLVATKSGASQARSACGPASCPIGSTETSGWRPTGSGGWWSTNSLYRCIYARRFVSVVAAYRFGLPQADKATLSTTLNGCLAGGDGIASLPERTVCSAKETGSVVRHSPRYVILAALGAPVLGWGLILRGRCRGCAASRRRRHPMSRH